MDRVAGKVALVTGATKGIGRACALHLAEEGAKVVAAARDARAGEDLAAEIRDAGGQAVFFALDVADEAGWKAIIERVTSDFGRLDILVNNAGVTKAAPIEELTLADWRTIMAVNAEGVFLATKYAIPAMRASGGGSIVNIASVLGITGTENLSAYTASKAAVRAFTKCAALECGRAGNGIRVNSVHPAFIHTPMMEETAIAMYGDVATGKAEFGKLHPIGHVGEPKDIADAVLYLASDESRFVTGAELVVDGGYTAI